jgi:ATP phosphoribosyltransferase regulatory subunit HisZ
MSRVAELIQQIVGLLQEDESLQLEFARAFLTNRVLQRLFQADPELRETLRRFILTDALLQLPEKIEPLLQLPEKIEPLLQLPERVAALEAAVSELRTVVNRIEPVVNRIEPIVNRIEPVVNRIEPIVNRIEPIVAEDGACSD